MARRGRPALDMSPEDRKRHRRVQLLESQRRRRAKLRSQQPNREFQPASPTQSESHSNVFDPYATLNTGGGSSEEFNITDNVPSQAPRLIVSMDDADTSHYSSHLDAWSPSPASSSMTSDFDPLASLFDSGDLATQTHNLNTDETADSTIPSTENADYEGRICSNQGFVLNENPNLDHQAPDRHDTGDLVTEQQLSGLSPTRWWRGTQLLNEQPVPTDLDLSCYDDMDLAQPMYIDPVSDSYFLEVSAWKDALTISQQYEQGTSWSPVMGDTWWSDSMQDSFHTGYFEHMPHL